MDEYKTSKLCHRCYNETYNVYGEKLKKVEKGIYEVSNSKIHSVLHCKSNECKKYTMNRDLNASRNILMLIRLKIENRERPE